jgi:hypothetical protein
VTYTLLVYDRAEARLISEESFGNRTEALRARFRTESDGDGLNLNREVVVLSSSSRDDLMRTHSRYFRGLQELAVDEADKVEPADPAQPE